MATSHQAMQAAVCFRELLGKVFNDLLEQVPDPAPSLRLDSVKTSLRSISLLYRKGLCRPSQSERSNWNDAAKRCAYFFLYFTHHCYLVYVSLQQVRPVSWKNKSMMKVCSIGGGPGSDLVGVTKFLRDANRFPSSLLQCLVLDLFPNWKLTWDAIYPNLPDDFHVTYKRCDLVRDTILPSDVLSFIRDVDLLTLVKSYSAVSAFFRTAPYRRELLRSILDELKHGCLVLFIDNEYEDDDFEEVFASSSDAFELVADFSGKASSPHGGYYGLISYYCSLFDYKPMRSCNVIIKVFRKNYSATRCCPERSCAKMKKLFDPDTFDASDRRSTYFNTLLRSPPPYVRMESHQANPRPKVRRAALQEDDPPYQPLNRPTTGQAILLVAGIVVFGFFSYVLRQFR
ncbi:uncharacterized protein LOC117293390 [Asterias rubens]|uniref:uncharacterized protein LOC117293390 n=1 Tax=Asterias rubens TaxID=7604 RepID=UPI0014554E69|nr:uncharacterized protein LOC117293390 [Asterias rubens]